jgi:ubiquinone biosynthesis protein
MEYYSVVRIYNVFRFLLTLFLIIKKKEKLIFLSALSPKKLKNIIISLGASFIKLAQVLATRSDFFDKLYLDELKELHDKLPAMSQKDFEEIFKLSFDKNPFKEISYLPIATASIGQVHIAYLEDGSKVAVKLRRKNIKEQVYADIKILNFFNKLFNPLFSHYTKNSIEAVINEFSSMIKQEINLSQELINLKKFSKLYEKSGIKFPIPVEYLCSENCIVMSFEEGFRFDDKEQLSFYKIDFKHIISKLVNFYTEQMLINGYFHADPHPGNLLVNTDGELILLDFGMVKNIPNDIRIAIIELIKSANERDFPSFIIANKKLGTISYEAPDDLLIEFSEKMFDIFSNENLSSESMQKLAFEVLESTRNLPFKLPSDAIYILRVSAIIEGLGTTYIENFNGVKDILPILQNNLPKALGAGDSLIETIIDEAKSFPFAIKNLKDFLHKANNSQLEVKLNPFQLEYLAKELKDFINPIIKSFAFIALGFFVLIYDKELSHIAIILVAFGFARILWK